MVFMLNLFLIGSGASGAVPFGTMLAILALYFLISGPLCVAGYYYGMRHGVSRSRSITNVSPLTSRAVHPPAYQNKLDTEANTSFAHGESKTKHDALQRGLCLGLYHSCTVPVQMGA